jgi:hypothetical protein
MMKTLLIGRERVSCGNETMGAIQTMYNVRLLGTNTMNAPYMMKKSGPSKKVICTPIFITVILQ